MREISSGSKIKMGSFSKKNEKVLRTNSIIKVDFEVISCATKLRVYHFFVSLFPVILGAIKSVLCLSKAKKNTKKNTKQHAVLYIHT